MKFSEFLIFSLVTYFEVRSANLYWEYWLLTKVWDQIEWFLMIALWGWLLILNTDGWIYNNGCYYWLRDQMVLSHVDDCYCWLQDQTVEAMLIRSIQIMSALEQVVFRYPPTFAAILDNYSNDANLAELWIKILTMDDNGINHLINIITVLNNLKKYLMYYWIIIVIV